MPIVYELMPAEERRTLRAVCDCLTENNAAIDDPDFLDLPVNRVYIDVKNRKWNVCVGCTSLERYKSRLWALKERLVEEIPELRGIEVCFAVSDTGDGPRTWTEVDGFLGDAEAWLKEHWDSLVDQLKRDTPAYTSWLASTSWSLQSDRMTVFVGHAFGVGILANKGFCGQLGELIAKSGGPRLEIDVAIGEEDSESHDFRRQFEREEEAYINSLLGTKEAMTKVARGVIIGRPIQADPVSISDVTEDENGVVLLGEIFELERRVLKSGKTLLTGSITDYTDSLNFKLMGEPAQRASDALKAGMWVKVRGNVESDRFMNDELVMTPADVNEAADPFARVDGAEEKRVELHLHTKMSAMDSTVETKDVVKLAAKWGHKAIAITDHGVVHDFPTAFSAAKSMGIKVLYGVEGYLVDDPAAKERPYHIIVIAKNRMGLTNLYKLVSEAHTEYFYRHPRFPRRLLAENREGLIIGSACEAGELFQAVLKGENDERLREIASFYDYLEIQPIGNNRFMIREGLCKTDDDLRDLNRKIVELGDRMGKPVAATCDVHFQEPRDSIYRNILMASQGFEDADKQAPLYFRTTEEMLAEFDYLGSDKCREVVVTNTNLIADWVEPMAPVPSDFAPPIIDGAEEEVRDMSYRKAYELYGDPLPAIVRERLDLELDSIISHGYAVLYLIAQKLVSRSIADGYVVGSRGSVGSSFVATMCGITEVNPLPPHYLCSGCKHSEFPEDPPGSGVDLPQKDCPVCGAPMKGDGDDIYFATFMGFEGDKEPDIDLNFSGEYQPEAHRFVEEMFGSEFIFRVGTIATLADKTVYGFVRKFLEQKGATKRNCEINRLIKGCVGVRRSTGQHPGGLVVVPRNRNIYEFTPVQYPANNAEKGKRITHFDFHSALESRLVKLDILGHDDPTMIHRLYQLTGVDPTGVPLNDPKVLDIFREIAPLEISKEDLGLEVGTWGIPEFNTSFTQQMLGVIRPTNFSELIYVSGFSHGTGVWLGNAAELLESKTARISEVISVRDCIMGDLIKRGMPSKQAFTIMEKVRKGKGLTDDETAAMRENNVPEWYIDSCRKIQYLFPKAHAVAYVTMAVRIAYFKIYYPEAFYAAYFSIRADDFDANLATKGLREVKAAIKEIDDKGRDASVKEKSALTDLQLVMEALLRGIEFLPVDIMESKATEFEIVAEGRLRCPLGSLKGVGENAARSVVSARSAGEFLSVEDLKGRAGIPSSVIEILREHGCLDGWYETSQMTLF